MNRRELKKVQAACLDLMEASLNLKIYLPVFGMGTNPDWPVIADEVKGLRRRLAKIEQLLGETQPVCSDDLQWRLTKHSLPDADGTVLMSIVGDDDAQEGFYTDSEDGNSMIWRYACGMTVNAQVYAWAEMPPSLRCRQACVGALTGGAS